MSKLSLAVPGTGVGVRAGAAGAASGPGIPDLISDDPTRPGSDFRWSPARYAIRNRWVVTGGDHLPAGTASSPSDAG